jgi:type IV pilus biogenesis protein PilP
VVRLLTIAVWLAVLASVVFWALRLLDSGKPAPPNARELSAESQATLSLSWSSLGPRLGVVTTQQQAALDVKVLGVVLQSGGMRAVLSLDNGRQSVVAQMGDELPDGSKVDRINAKEVVLLRNSAEIRVPVPEPKDSQLDSSFVSVGPLSRPPPLPRNLSGVNIFSSQPSQLVDASGRQLAPSSKLQPSGQPTAQPLPAGARDR